VPRRPKQVVVSHKDIGLRIKRLRQDQALTQVALAQRLELTQSNLSAIERGIRGVTVNQVARIAKALHASTDEILFGENLPTPRKSIRHRRLMLRLQQTEQLPDSDRRVLLTILEGMLRTHEARKAKRQARAGATQKPRVA
jgi:transcriptional regulator with XRE-family HTH domain